MDMWPCTFILTLLYLSYCRSEINLGVERSGFTLVRFHKHASSETEMFVRVSAELSYTSYVQLSNKKCNIKLDDKAVIWNHHNMFLHSASNASWESKPRLEVMKKFMLNSAEHETLNSHTFKTSRNQPFSV